MMKKIVSIIRENILLQKLSNTCTDLKIKSIFYL